MTEKEIKDKRLMRNVKDRERYANSEEFRKKNAYKRSKTEAKRFVTKLGVEQDLIDLKALLDKRLKEF
jgi:hypothetical protein|nr:MAG TPA: hypothetical protein [Caudoviricetes sp.]